MSKLPSPLRSATPITGQPPQYGSAFTDCTIPDLSSQIWFDDTPSVTTASTSPSLLKSAAPTSVQPDGSVSPDASVTTSLVLCTT